MRKNYQNREDNRSILVFASRIVGYEALRFLLEEKMPVKKVIAGKPQDRNILALADSFGISVEIFSNMTQADLVEEGKLYTWILNLWSPHILNTSVLKLAEKRLNIHPGLVPLCRGNDNAAWCIRKGLPAGVALIEMDDKIDAGGVYAQKELPYSFPIRGKELHDILQREAVIFFKEMWQDIYDEKVQPQKQTGVGGYYTREDTERDRVRLEDTTFTLDEWIRWVLAHDFSPGTTAEVKYQDKTYKLSLIIEEKRPLP